MRNWEVQVQFHVHGSGKTLFGDGFAMWYTKDRSELGPVFGSRDYFTGLGVFFDTYSNHNGEHSHPHPYVSAVIFNGTQPYDHDRDGTHSEIAGCHVNSITTHCPYNLQSLLQAQFRNLDTDTHASIMYADRTLSVQLDVDGNFEWQECFNVADVDLPAGYFFGASAATGELADNHDIISVKVFELDASEGDGDKGDDWTTVSPGARVSAAPRAHIPDLKKSSTSHTIMTIFIVIMVLVVLAVVAYFLYDNYRQKSNKRLF
jgi:mannose-binding lectin 2